MTALDRTRLRAIPATTPSFLRLLGAAVIVPTRGLSRVAA